MNLVLKILTTTVVIACVLFSSATKSIIRLSYEINKLEIIQQFCVNKEVKTFKCHGKCYLQKQLKKTEKDDNNIPQLEDNKVQLFQISFLPMQIIPLFSYEKFYSRKEGIPQTLTNSLFRPPIV